MAAKSVTKLLFADGPEAHCHDKILGGGVVGTHSGDMLGESIGMAAEIAHGSCTDVPPARK